MRAVLLLALFLLAVAAVIAQEASVGVPPKDSKAASDGEAEEGMSGVLPPPDNAEDEEEEPGREHPEEKRQGRHPQGPAPRRRAEEARDRRQPELLDHLRRRKGPCAGGPKNQPEPM